MIQKITVYFLLATFILALTSCATTHSLGDGVVVAARPVGKHDYRPGYGAKTGAKTGGTIGAVAGGVYGAGIGLVVGAMAGGSTGCVPCLFIGPIFGGIFGATLFGLPAAAVGGTLGYTRDLMSNDKPYEFTVKPVNKSNTLTIQQYSPAIPLNTKVHILEKDGNIFIRR